MKPKLGSNVLNQESYNDDEKLSIRQGKAAPLSRFTRVEQKKSPRDKTGAFFNKKQCIIG